MACRPLPPLPPCTTCGMPLPTEGVVSWYLSSERVASGSDTEFDFARIVAACAPCGQLLELRTCLDWFQDWEVQVAFSPSRIREFAAEQAAVRGVRARRQAWATLLADSARRHLAPGMLELARLHLGACLDLRRAVEFLSEEPPLPPLPSPPPRAVPRRGRTTASAVGTVGGEGGGIVPASEGRPLRLLKGTPVALTGFWNGLLVCDLPGWAVGPAPARIRLSLDLVRRLPAPPPSVTPGR